MQPRIYTYKITFKEIPDWYWGVHKEKEHGEFYMGSPKTHAWKWEFYTPCLQICEVFPYTEEGWAKAREVEDRCIKPDLNNPLCLNEHVGGWMSLETNRRNAKKGAEKLHEKKNHLGKSVHGVKSAERMHKVLHEKKTESGESAHAVKAGSKGAKNTNAQKWRDPDHPELGEYGPGVLAQMQKARGYPHKKENRIKVG